MKYFVIVTIAVFFFLVATPAFMAQAPCTPVYGGGQQTDGSSYCVELVKAAEQKPNPTPGFQTPNDTMTNTTTTKGGYAVQSTPGVTKQPNTGPEMLGLVALLPAAYAGLKLRKKAAN